jgi:prepilin-type N-terminal cleavage/methylation domain-containing protein
VTIKRRQDGRSRPPRGGGGFTLVELSVAVAVTSVIMVGMGSAMLIAGRALPEARSPTASRLAAARAAEDMATELQYAAWVNQRSPNMIEFVTADRNADEIPETIRYEWSGTSGAPLLRQYNGGAPVSILTDVCEFGLSYNVMIVTARTPEGNESGQTTLSGYSTTQGLHDCSIQNIESYAECFFPVLPANTVSWKVTRVVISAKQDGTADGEASVQLQTATAGHLPSGTVLEEKPLLESTLLPTYLEQEFTFSAVGDLSPTQGLCLVVKWVANDIACKVRARNGNVTDLNIALARSTDGGLTWAALPNQSMLFAVYGTVTTSTSPQVQNTYYLEGVDIKLRSGGDSRAVVQTGVRLLNRPEVNQ